MEQQFSLSWNNFHGNLSRGFAGLLGKGEFVDVSLAVEGHILQAHKVVLSICSPYFKKMFQTNPCQHPIVVLRDVTHKAMKDLLQFMYHGEVSVKQEDLTSFIGTAEVLQIKGLTNKEMDDEQEEEMPKQISPPITNNIATVPRQSLENLNSEDLVPNEEINLQRQLMERLNKLTALKRKSDEYMKTNFDLNSLPQQYVVTEKRPKLREKLILNRHNIAARRNSFEMKKNNVFDEVPTNMSTYVDQISTVSVPQEGRRLALDSHDYNDNKNVLPSPDQQMMKVEFEDGSELAIADMAQSDSSKLSEANDSSMDHQNVREVLMTPPIQEDALSLVVGNGGTENQSLPLRYKYIYSRKGHKQLVHMNFVYTKHSTSHGKTSWRCVQYFSLNRCPATVETVEAMIYAVHHQHNHEDCFDKIAKNSVYEMTSTSCKE